MYKVYGGQILHGTYPTMDVARAAALHYQRTHPGEVVEIWEFKGMVKKDYFFHEVPK